MITYEEFQTYASPPPLDLLSIHQTKTRSDDRHFSQKIRVWYWCFGREKCPQSEAAVELTKISKKKKRRRMMMMGRIIVTTVLILH
jgi:hypothetical protein